MRYYFSWINLAFYLVLSDALLNYFLQTFYQRLPILALAPVFLAAHLLVNSSNIRSIKPHYYILITLGFVGYAMAIVTAEATTPANRFLEVLSAFSAWFIGYFWFIHNVRRPYDKWWGVLIIAFIHIAVCCVALLKFAPAYFPTYDHVWSLNGALITRPAVTTDQNFQIFYLLPVAAIFAFFTSKSMFIISGLSLLASAYVLAALQTRSGILVLVGVLAFSVGIQFFSKGKMKIRAITLTTILTLIGSGVVLYKMEYIYGLVLRFTQESFATGYGRLHGFVYFFEKVINPMWWIPRGHAEYVQLTGSIPHSNITAHFLEGGILGVVCWMGLVVIPACKLSWMVVTKAFQRDAAIICSICIGSFVAQLSLNVPFVDQIWLWGGVSCASLMVLKANLFSNNAVKKQRLQQRSRANL